MLKYLSLFLATSILSANAFAETLIIETKTGQSIAFDVELALTPEQQRDGLMNRDTLKPQGGMLFMFDKVSRPQFWMKDTRFGLDMIYIAKDGTIAGIHPNAIAYDTTPILAPAECIAVLEIAAEAVETQGIAKGDKVIHKFFKKDEK